MRAFQRRAWLCGVAMGTALIVTAAHGAAGAEAPLHLASAGGDAWSFDKLVTAEVDGEACDTVLFKSPAASILAQPRGGVAMARIPLEAGDNLVTAQCRAAGADRAPAAEQRWHVRLADLPKARIRTVARGDAMSLDAGASELAPGEPAAIVSYEWQAREGNPAPLAGLPARGKHIRLDAPPVDGEYYVTLRVTDSAGRSDSSVAVFQVRDGRPTPVDLARAHPAWADQAMIYGLSPYFFGLRGLRDVRAQLDDLKALGVNTLWLSPITATTGRDFGYAVTDYFRLRDNDADDLHALVAAAHARKMRVILDLAVNHVSAEHRYFADAQEHGPESPYYAFFDRDADGNATHYFNWRNLENLNYDNPEVKRWVTEAFAYWLRSFDVDGFRVDAAWGPQRRAPEFWGAWRAEMKRIKPDVLLIAEASARDPYFFENGFDAAYDWTEELGHWAWEAAFDDSVATAAKLRAAILASQSLRRTDGLVFRFLDNNDTGPRFVTRYGVARTRLASALLLTLPGLPALYWGDEIGAEYVPYHAAPPSSWDDDDGLRAWYTRLIALRGAHPALRSRRIRFLDIAPGDRLLAYVRPGDEAEQDVVVLLNWGDAPLSVPLGALSGRGGFLDLLSGETLAGDAGSVSLPAYGVRVFGAGPKKERPPEGGLSVTTK